MATGGTTAKGDAKTESAISGKSRMNGLLKSTSLALVLTVAGPAILVAAEPSPVESRSKERRFFCSAPAPGLPACAAPDFAVCGASGDQKALVATGFMASFTDHPKAHDFIGRKYQITTDMVDTIGQALLRFPGRSDRLCDAGTAKRSFRSRRRQNEAS